MTGQEYANMRKSRAADSKYHAKKVVNKYGKFDSVHEFNTYLYLLDLRAKNIITDLHRQVCFELIPAQYEDVEIQTKRGKKMKHVCVEKSCSYYADFTYLEDGKLHVVDAKGVRTPTYAIKKKLMLFVNGIKIEEV